MMNIRRDLWCRALPVAACSGPVLALAVAAAAPAGYSPLNLRSAYGLDFSDLTGGVGQTVAVVTAYDDPTAETGMGTYRSQYSIPACTTANGYFSRVNATGGTSFPPTGPVGWPLATAQSAPRIENGALLARDIYFCGRYIDVSPERLSGSDAAALISCQASRSRLDMNGYLRNTGRIHLAECRVSHVLG